MKTCRSCKFWEPPRNGKIEEINNPGLCENEKVSAGDYCEKDEATATDPYSQLMPGPDFGCIHHEDA